MPRRPSRERPPTHPLIAILLAGLWLAGAARAQTADAEAAPPTPETARAELPSDDVSVEKVDEAEPRPMVADEATKAKLGSDPRFSTPPPTLDATEHDLLLLNSGEWLQGNIDGIRDGVIEFDSIELEDIEIDLENVKEIHANRVHTYRFEGRRDILTGPARMNAEVFVIDGEERPRDIFMSQVPGKPRERNYWNGDFSVGYSVRSGNTDQSDLTARAELNRETALTRFTNLYNATFSTADNDAGDSETTANSHRLNSAFDVYVTTRLYLIVPAVEIFADEFQNINLRVTPNAGVGYEWLNLKRVTWDVNAAGGYTYTDRVSVPAGDAKSSSNGVVILGTQIETDPTSAIEWDTSYTAQVVPADMDLTNHHLESIVSIDLFFSLDLDVTFIWDRIEGPEPLVADPGPPVVLQPVQQNDYRLTFGIGWDF